MLVFPKNERRNIKMFTFSSLWPCPRNGIKNITPKKVLFWVVLFSFPCFFFRVQKRKTILYSVFSIPLKGALGGVRRGVWPNEKIHLNSIHLCFYPGEVTNDVGIPACKKNGVDLAWYMKKFQACNPLCIQSREYLEHVRSFRSF